MLLTIIRRISVVLLVGLSLFFSAQNLSPLWKAKNPQAAVQRILQLFGAGNSKVAAKNEISIWENRFDSVKQGLPAGVDHVGYVSDGDLDLPSAQNSDSGQINEFRMTRYVMAPVIVQEGIDYPWIIGNFSSINTKRLKSWLLDKVGNCDVQEFSGGIYLIHKAQK